jgi:hypothetical protein
VNAPSLFVVGGTNEKDASPSALDTIEKLDRTVVIGFTVKVVLIVPDVYLSLLAWFAVMVDVPAPRIVMMLPSIVATSVFELV